MLRGFFRRQEKQRDTQLSEDASQKYLRIRDQGTARIQAAVAPGDLNKIEGRIRNAFSLYYRWSSNNADIRAAVHEEILATREIPGLARVFMFHGDGRVREEALARLDGPLIAPANVYALCWRMNDWASEVRRAAQQAAERVMPLTPATVIAPALKAIMPHMHSWGRWSEDGPEMVRRVLQRPDVMGLLIEDVATTRQSGLSLLLRQLARCPEIDAHLERVFTSAPLPHIRAMALEMLLSGKARWPTGKRQRIWIDRSMGAYKMQPAFAERDLAISTDPVSLVETGATDRAAIVRKRAADGLIALRHDQAVAGACDRIAHALENDPNIGVRSRIEFYFRKRNEHLS